MHTDIETTIELDTTEFKSSLRELANHKGAFDIEARRGRGSAKPPKVYRGRQVLIPGKRKAQRHPWADRLHAARTGGFVVDQTHPDTNLIVGTCYACGDRFGFIYGDEPMRAEFEARAKRHQMGEFDGIRDCQRGVTL